MRSLILFFLSSIILHLFCKYYGVPTTYQVCARFCGRSGEQYGHELSPLGALGVSERRDEQRGASCAEGSVAGGEALEAPRPRAWLRVDRAGAPCLHQKVEGWQRPHEGPSRGGSPTLLLPFARRSPVLALRGAPNWPEMHNSGKGMQKEVQNCLISLAPGKELSVFFLAAAAKGAIIARWHFALKLFPSASDIFLFLLVRRPFSATD